jgi:peptide-methionine (R)-S-oxide reductase
MQRDCVKSDPLESRWGMGARSGKKTRSNGVAFGVGLVALWVVLALTCGACASEEDDLSTQEDADMVSIDKVVRSEEEWKAILPAERYKVLREKGTEPPYTGEYDDHWEDGVYQCYACGLPLFDSTSKFHSGTGWPSFWQPISPSAVAEHADSSYGMVRTEVTCARCGGHLGHVFNDGPEPTGLRYCINSLALKFVPR